jgi:ubiquinone/menaquinone biosynthesis C-methylase UbiE
VETRTIGQDLPDNFYEKIKPRLYRRIGRELRVAGYVIDLGCGSCGLVEYLADTYHQRVTGVDISRESFPKRRRSQDGRQFHCIRQDAAQLGFARDQSSDAVVMLWSLHEMDRPKSVLAEAYRTLRPGGKILVVDFPRDSLAQRLWNEDYYRPDELKRLLITAGFAGVRVRLIEQQQVLWARGHHPSSRAP